MKKYTTIFKRKREPVLDNNEILDLIFALAIASGVTPTKLVVSLQETKIFDFAHKVSAELKVQMDKDIDRAVEKLLKGGIKAKHIKR